MLRGTILKEHQYTLHAAGGHVEVVIANCVALVFSDFAVPEDVIVQVCEACGILVANHAGQLWLDHHAVLQADVLDVVRGVGITRGQDHAVVVVEGEFILQAVPERALIERHVALERIEIQLDVESIAISIGNGLVCCNRCILISSTNSDSFCVSVVRLVNAMVLGVLPLLCCLPEIIVTVVDITVIQGHHLVARNSNCGLFNDGAAKVLNHSPVGIFTVQRDPECQPRGPRYNHIMGVQTGKADEQLLVLGNRPRIVGNDH